jgi:hypothetical protein
MRCLGNSGIALSCRHLYIDGLFGYRVAKHLVGSRAVSGCVTEIKNLQADCVGNALCLDGEAGLLPVESTALVEDFVSRNARGRAKCDGNNWAIEGVAWEFYQDSLLNLNYWPAFDLARRPRRCNIDGFVSVNYTKTGFGSNTDPSTSEGTTLNNVKITNSMSAFKLNQQMTINNSRRYGIHHAYRGNGPSSGSTNNVDVFTLSDAQWAKILDDQNTLMAAANTEWQTQFQPANVWVPKVISDIMVTQ